MARDSRSDDAPDPLFVLAHGGLTNRIAQRLGLLQPPISRRYLRALVLILITWLPLLLLSGFSGHILGNTVAIAMIRDPEVNCRFLLALPFLDLAEVILVISLSAQISQFSTTGIVPQQERSRFDALLSRIQRWHSTVVSEIVLMLLAIACSLFARLYLMRDSVSSWERYLGNLTPAGWWHMLVSLPVLYFFLLRGLWIFLLWMVFLYRVSRLNLALTPTHPDKAGGLGFLGWGLASFAPTVFGYSTVISAGFAYEIYHKGESLQTLKFHLIIFILLVTAIVHLPVLAFSGRLSRARFAGLLEFGALAWRHDRAFDEKWIHQPQSKNQSPLGSMDVQSLANMAMAYEHIQEMHLIPWDRLAVLVLLLSAAVPLVPLVGTEIPFTEIFSKLVELLI